MTSHVLISSPFLQPSVTVKYIIDDLMNMIGDAARIALVGPFVRLN